MAARVRYGEQNGRCVKVTEVHTPEDVWIVRRVEWCDGRQAEPQPPRLTRKSLEVPGEEVEEVGVNAAAIAADATLQKLTCTRTAATVVAAVAGAYLAGHFFKTGGYSVIVGGVAGAVVGMLAANAMTNEQWDEAMNQGGLPPYSK